MEADSRLPSIQLLRGLAALAVACVHLWFGFATYIDDRGAAPPWSGVVSQAAVAAFFVISGAVMVISSRRLFGSWRGTLTFWRRRAVRVLPPYWLATLLFTGVALWLGLPFDPAFMARSLLFVPGDSPSQVPFLPFLWPGWTLFYELGFYAIFGAFLVAPRGKALGYTAGVLVLIVASAAIWRPETYLAFAFARPIVLLFVIGMLAGLLLAADQAIPVPLRVLAAIGAIGALALGPGLAPNSLGWDWLAAAGLPGTLAFLAVAGGRIPPRLAGPADTFGNLSYALYLLHVPFAHAWMQLFNAWLPHPGGSFGYMLTGVPLLLLLSFAFHRWIERPLTAVLNRWLERVVPPPTCRP